MKTVTWTLSLALLSMVSGCTNGAPSGQSEDTNLARQVFVAETNAVEVMPLTLRDFNKQIISNGKLEARNKAALTFLTSGRLAMVNVRNGSHVNEGDIIASLDTEDAKIQLDRARLAYSKAELELADRLLDFDYGPGTDTATVPRGTMQIVYLRSGYLDAKQSLEQARLNLARSTLKAPFSGKAADIRQKVHEQVAGNFCTLIDDAVFNVKFSVLETEIGFVKTGQPVKVYAFNDPQNIVRGKITEINPTVDASGQIQVIAQIANNGQMLDGMNVRILAENVVPDQLVVPKSAVVIRDNLEVLFRYSKGKSVWTYVNTTASNSTEYVVAANTERNARLNVGDTVIISGNLNLGGDTSVEIVTNN